MYTMCNMKMCMFLHQHVYILYLNTDIHYSALALKNKWIIKMNK